MTNRYICIHGHFYQPPRENAWLEAIEVQDSAHPYHDWNERITAECYAANAASRILDEQGYIVHIVCNYDKMSFNFGPSLLSWMQENAPGIYQAILQADKTAAARFNGHGAALAQVYNHMIMPLANRRDKITQIGWAIRDFEYRFGRPPEGMWLPETAVDMETLDILAQNGITFTLLSPNQADKVRPQGSHQWLDVSNGSIDTTQPYFVTLAGGKTIALFFYHGELSHAVAFEQLSGNGDRFYERLLDGFPDDEYQDRLVHVCSDGETYGHHHSQGDMGLAYALHRLEQSHQVQLTNYGAYLETHPPLAEVRIKENTSWSCVHGVERWRSDCGCSSGGHPQWRQRWREPLRAALDWLRDTLAPAYEAELAGYLKDPWRARDHYIEVLLHRDYTTIERFLRRESQRSLSPSDQVMVLKFLEMQRHLMLMYTSCGWFFDELSGIETVQILQYAGRALQLAAALLPQPIEQGFLEILARAPSNIAAHGDGRRMYEKWIRLAAVGLTEVGAHFAISSLFQDYQEENRLYCFSAVRRDYHYREAGRSKLAHGRVAITSQITWESAEFVFAVLHFGDHNIACGLKRPAEAENYQEMQKEIMNAFLKADFPAVVQKLDRYFSGPLYSMKSLFRDEQRGILGPILQSRSDEAISMFRAVYTPNVPLMRFLSDTNTLVPRPLAMAGELVLNHTLQQELARDHLDHEQIRDLIDQAGLAGVPIDETNLEYTLRKSIERQNAAFETDPTSFEVLDNLATAVELVYALPFHVELRQVQNTHFRVGRSWREDYRQRAEKDRDADQWLKRFDQLGEKLLLRPWIENQMGP